MGNDERDRLIRETVLNGMSILEASKTWGLSRQRIHQIVGEAIKGRKKRRTNDHAIIELANKGMGSTVIAKTLSLHPDQVREVLHRTNTRPTNLRWSNVLERLNNGELPSDIAVATGFTLSNVRRIKQASLDGGNRRIMATQPRRRTVERDVAIWEEYRTGASISSLADKYSLSVIRIYQILSYERSKSIKQIVDNVEETS